MSGHRAVLGLTVALSAALAGGGCSGGDATVVGTPASETMAPPPGARSSDSGAPAPSGDGGAGRYSEAPATVAASAAGYARAEVGARERGYLTALEKAGLKPGPLSEPLVAAGNTICRIKATGGAASETTVIANAVAGQVVAGGYSTESVEDIARIVIDTSAGTLCP